MFKYRYFKSDLLEILCQHHFFLVVGIYLFKILFFFTLYAKQIKHHFEVKTPINKQIEDKTLEITSLRFCVVLIIYIEHIIKILFSYLNVFNLFTNINISQNVNEFIFKMFSFVYLNYINIYQDISILNLFQEVFSFFFVDLLNLFIY